jgi:putative hemolysin
MIALFAVIAAVSILLIAILSYIQLLYGEGLRLRRRESPGLEHFQEEVQPRLKMETDFGQLVFSLAKQSALILMALSFYGLAAAGNPLISLVQAVVYSIFGMLFFSFFVPKLLFRRSRGLWLIWLLPLLLAVSLFFRPLAMVLQFVQSLLGISDESSAEQEETTTAEDIEALIDAGTEEGLIEEQDRKLIQSVVEFRDKTVREVMTPRPKMVSVAADVTLEDLRQLVINEQFSRIPVHEETVDRVIGFIHVRDMFEMEPEERAKKSIRDILRPIRLVPETKPVKSLLEEMQAEGTHMVIVVSEYGQTAGLATMEDLVEEILGEIRDEHEPARDVVTEEEGVFVVAGSYDVDHLYELVEFRADDETESTTIGGLVTEWLGHVPNPGESVEKNGVRLEVLAADDFRVDRVRISRVPDDPEEEAEARESEA